MWHFLGFPFFFVCFFDDHGAFPFGGSACKIFGRNQALMEICKEVFFGGLPSLQLLYYHNSIYMSIVKKKIVASTTIYFSIPFLLSILLPICRRGNLEQKMDLAF